MRVMRVILNGKFGGDAAVRAAIYRLREKGHRVEVRCTWESGDAARLASEAAENGVDVVVAGGGDGTVHEVVNGLMAAERSSALAFGVLPLGTANDFARACGIPLEPLAALTLACEGTPVPIDIPSANGTYFVNVASGGFGAEVTVGTDPQLKRALGGTAYALTGVMMAARIRPYDGAFVRDEGAVEGTFIALAVGNARYAGGGIRVAPHAMLDDGLLDVMVISNFEMSDLGTVINELQNFDNQNNKFVHYLRASSFEIQVPKQLPINLDGEPYRLDRIKFECGTNSLRLVAPPDCPLIGQAKQ